MDRDVDCAYPQPKRRRRDALWTNVQAQSLPPLPTYPDANMPGPSSIGLEGWDAMGAVGIDDSLFNEGNQYAQLLPQPLMSPLLQRNEVESVQPSSISRPWFLQEETWTMQQSSPGPGCTADLDYEPYVEAVEQMLHSWVQHGHNSFVHRRLYKNGMPPCIQDAFTTLAAYVGRTSAVKSTILQIADDRAISLACQEAPAASGAQGLLAHLARVQALFVYQFIRLFDGSVRLRASAEQQLPTLRLWVTQMWDAARRYQGDDLLSGRALAPAWTTNFDREYDASTASWNLWILSESVRRTHLIIDTILNTYQTMTKGLAECTGGVMFTARRGLWEAESAVAWSELCSRDSPLLMSSMHPENCIAQHSSDEIDDFVKMFWTFIVGTDKIQCWNDKSHAAIGG